MKKLFCAYCKKLINDETGLDSEQGYYKALDNFLQIKYFDSDEDNIFCSQDCACRAIMLEFIPLDQ
jgi:hypothetical protein